MKILKKDLEEIMTLLSNVKMSVVDTEYELFLPLAQEVPNSSSAAVGDIVMTSTRNVGIGSAIKAGLVYDTLKEWDKVYVGFANIDYQFKFPFAEAIELGLVSGEGDLNKLSAYDMYLVPKTSVLITFTKTNK